MASFEKLKFCRTEDFEKNSEYAKAWKKDDDGGVISDQPRITVGDSGMGPQGGYITRLLNFLFSITFSIQVVLFPFQSL